MVEAEENPFHGFNNTNGEEITEDIQHVEQDPNFHKSLENIFKRNGENTSLC